METATATTPAIDVKVLDPKAGAHPNHYEMVAIGDWEFGRRGDLYYELCDRCWGRAYMSEYAHAHDGICYLCNKIGTGRTVGTVTDAAALAARWEAEKQDMIRAQEQRLAREEELARQWREENPDVVDYLATRDPKTFTGWREDLYNIAYAMREHNMLDDDDTAAVRRIIAKEATFAKRDAERAAKSRHVGTKGERLTFDEVKIEFVRVLEGTAVGYRGQDKRWVTFITPGGEILKWKTAADYWPEDRGTVGKLTGKVLNHSTFRGTPETILTNCRFTPAD